ncbi:hypothetical protein JHK84_042758 [Glycine max]|nr:hypothetical protein JHK84_042758 [Glycine max]
MSYRNDAEVVKEIVNLVLKRLAKPKIKSKGLHLTIKESPLRKEKNEGNFLPCLLTPPPQTKPFKIIELVLTALILTYTISLNDAAVVKEIVNLVLKTLVKPHVISKGLVGIEEKITTIESWIREKATDISLIGIWGMGGIGKTTLAEQVFNKLHSEYKGSYFLAREREESKRHEIISLKEKFFSGLLGYDVKICTPSSLPEDIVKRIGCMKVLIVIDDVNDLDHLEKLFGTLDNFGSGSKIIVTLRLTKSIRHTILDNSIMLKHLNFSI